MRKLISFVGSMLLVSASAFATTRTETEAQQQAANVLKKSINIQLADVEIQNNDTLYYIFKGLPNGYAIVDANAQHPAVLAYDADLHYQGKDAMPTPLRHLLANYCNNPQETETYNGLADGQNGLKVFRITGTEIKPLLGDIEWGQRTPFNDNCPTDGGEKCPTGCVATALSQIMKFHEYPAATQAKIPAYTTKTKGIQVSAISKGASFDWSNMLDNYTEGFSTKQGSAVAKLLAAVGTAVEMDYKSKESSASVQMQQLVTYFGYDRELIRQFHRWHFTNSEWSLLLLDELKAKRPFYILGQSQGGGHAFVIDGINKEGLFHVNWGWNGSYNGYFDITLLCPLNNDGDGASTTTDGYTGQNIAILGILPNNGKNDPTSEAPSQCQLVLYFSMFREDDGVFSMTYFPIKSGLATPENITVATGYVDDNGKVCPVSDFVPIDESEMAVTTINVSKLKKGTTYKFLQLESEDGGKTFRVSPGGTLGYTLLKYETDGTFSEISETYSLKGKATATEFFKLNKKAKGIIHLENKGKKEYYEGICVYTNSTKTKPEKPSYTVNVTVEAGETNDIPFDFMPKTDTVYYWITENYGSQITSGFFVRDTREYKLTASGEDFFYAADCNDVKFIFNIENSGDLDYNNYFYFYCSPKNNLTDIFRNPNDKKMVKVAADGSAVVDFYYTDDDPENSTLYYWIVDADNVVRYHSFSMRDEKNYNDLDISFKFSGFAKVGDDVKVKVSIKNTGDELFWNDVDFVVNKVDSFPELAFNGSGDDYIVFSEEDIFLQEGESANLEFSFKSESDSIYYYLVGYFNNVMAKGLLLVGCKDYVEMVSNDQQPVLWITTQRHTLTVQAVTESPVMVVSANGRILANRFLQEGETFTLNLSPGIYIVNGKKVVME